MRRICWDTMLFIYLLEGNPGHVARVREILAQCYERGDFLCCSYLALGEVMAGANLSANQEKETVIQNTIREMGFHFLPFDEGAVLPFSRLRAKEKLRAADAIHLACAASAGVDLFLTGDKQLTKLYVPGVRFIADIYTPLI
ncbi:MAG: type II toxin-antitoxin system VapC family toxin [Silvibacterium sp.]